MQTQIWLVSYKFSGVCYLKCTQEDTYRPFHIYIASCDQVAISQLSYSTAMPIELLGCLILH